MHIQAQILEEIKQIEGDDFALNKLLEYLRALVRTRKAHTGVEASIVKGLQEIKQEKNGELTLNSLENLIHELGN